MGENYFNSIPWREARLQLGHCRSMAKEEFADGVNALKGKKIVIVGCGAQGLNQGMCLRDSGLDVSYALRKSAKSVTVIGNDMLSMFTCIVSFLASISHLRKAVKALCHHFAPLQQLPLRLIVRCID